VERISPTVQFERASAIVSPPKETLSPSRVAWEIQLTCSAHCFKRSALRSSVYIVQDLIAIAVCVYAALNIETVLDKFNLSPVAYKAAQIVLYAAYAIACSFPATGIWVIAHECGHQAFSPSKTINNTVGWVLHSALLVPYHSWRISHGRHHASTGHLTRDEVFVPKTRKERGLPAKLPEETGLSVPAFRQAELRDALAESPIASLWGAILQQTFGWPMYLIRNASGQRHYPEGTNHFSPSSIIFKPSHFWQIVASDIGLAITFGVLYYWGTQRGFGEVARLYLPVYLLVNNWLVFITYLQASSSPGRLIALLTLTAHRPRPPPLLGQDLDLRSRCPRHHRP